MPAGVQFARDSRSQTGAQWGSLEKKISKILLDANF